MRMPRRRAAAVGVRRDGVLDRHRCLLVVVMLAASAAVRVGFVLRLPHLPLYWDEVHYDAWARAYAGAWDSIGAPALFLARLRAAFESSIQKGEAYSAFVGLVYAVAGAQPAAVFIVQALLDTLTCLFVYKIARALGGTVVGLVALGLAGVYEPFIFSAGRLQTETLCACVYLAGLYAFLSGSQPWPAARPADCRTWKATATQRLSRARSGEGAVRPNRRRSQVQGAAGFLIALAMLVRPTLQFLFPLLLVLLCVVHRNATSARRLRPAVAFAAGFFLLIGPRLVVTHALFGHPTWSGTTDPSTNAFAGILSDNLGWRTDRLSFANPPRGELLEVMRQSGLESPTDAQYRRATVLTWQRHPIQSVAVLCHKAYQVWAHPYNDSRRRLLIGPRWLRVWHQTMLVLAAIGTPLALRRWRAGVPVVATILYLWSAYLAVQIEVRYVVTAVPLMLCCAGLALVWLGNGLRSCWQSARSWVVGMLVATTLALIVVLRVGSLGRLLDLSPALAPVEAHGLRTVVMMLVLSLVAALVFLLLRAVLPVGWALASALLPLAVGSLLFLVGRPPALMWRQWPCPLTSGHGVVRQDFQLPAGLTPPARAELRLDLIAAGAGVDDLVVTVDGHEAHRFVGGPQRKDAVPTEAFYNQIFDGQGRPQRCWHAWYAVPVDAHALAASRSLHVEARVEGQGTGGDVVTVFGDYPLDAESAYDGPSVFSPGYFADTSVYKYLGDGDFRMRRRVPLIASSRSSFLDGQAWSTTDLSAAAGRQYGRYRIFLLLAYPDRRVVYVL